MPKSTSSKEFRGISVTNYETKAEKAIKIAEKFENEHGWTHIDGRKYDHEKWKQRNINNVKNALKRYKETKSREDFRALAKRIDEIRRIQFSKVLGPGKMFGGKDQSKEEMDKIYKEIL